MNDKVSIVIPIYKAEAYLKECFDSVLDQTYENIEVILVDDGSPDCCPVICDEYSKKDSRVIVIHKSNGGASSARNAGLERASGKYICFVDSDDRLPPNSVNALVSSLIDNKTDYAVGICVIRETGKFKSQIDKNSVIDFEDDPKELLRYITQTGSYSPYAKIYLSELIKNNSIKFNENLKCSEDALFIRTYLRYCKRISLVSEVVYEYTSANESSLSKKRYAEFCSYYAEKMKALADLCETLKLERYQKESFLYERAVHGLCISTIHYMNHWESENERKRYIKKSIEILLPWLDKNVKIISEVKTIDKATLKWWLGVRGLLNEQDFDKFYMMQLKYHKQRSFKRRVIDCIKK